MGHPSDSYPPPLRHLNHHGPDEANPPLSDEANPTLPDDLIPVIDLLCLNDAVFQDKENKKLNEACEDWGVFRLVNHGVPKTLLEQLNGFAKQVFSMDFESKQASCDNSPVSYFWGTPALTPAGAAISGGPRRTNWVEGFNVPLGQLPQFQPHLLQLQSFRDVLEEYGRHLSRIARTLFAAMARNLDLDLHSGDSRSDQYLSDKTGDVRVYRYPRCPNADEVGWGLESHTDSSVISVLTQDAEVCGLEVLRDDRWLAVKPVSDTLTINLGDMMQAISGDKYKSVTHRVKLNREKERISICYFVFPQEDAVIESSNYRPFSYNDFRAQVQKDIKDLGFKVGLSRFSPAHQKS